MSYARLIRAYRFWQRNFDVYKCHYKASLVGNVIEPILFLFGMGIGLGSLVGQIDGVSYMKFIGPGIMVVAAMYSAALECTFGAYTRMVEQQVYDGALATPLSLDDIVLGEIAWGATKSVISALLMLVVLTLFGIFDNYVEIPLIMLNIVLFGASMSAIALCVSAVSKSYDFFNFFITLFLAPMLLFTGVYFPMAQLPEWFAKFFLLFPTTHAVTVNRFLFHGGDWVMPLVGALYLFVFPGIGAKAARYLIRRRMLPKD